MLALGFSFLGMLGLLLLLNVSQDYSRGFILIWLSISALALIVERAMACRWIRGLHANGPFKTPVAVYGSRAGRQRVCEALQVQSFNTAIVGHFAAHQDATDVEVSGGLEALISFGQNNDCDQIVIALPLSAKEEIRDAVERLSVLPVDLVLLPDLDPLPVSITGCRVIDRLPAFEVQRRPFSHNQYLTKSAVDLILSAAGAVLLAPIFILVALAIKLDSPGPVFFRQRRHGYNHKVIQVLKFRTMTVMENDGEIRQAKAEDERVTRVGRLLRRTSADELPQLWNVLKGEMSLVGPRPHAVSHNIYYANLWKNYSNRHRVKPGITGWAQVNGLRGETSDPEKMRQRARFDLYYIENWTLGLDLEILLRTAAVVLEAKNAH
jgi:putative colanic acid biosynthesis UDP-glucose lipid carrier transferase